MTAHKKAQQTQRCVIKLDIVTLLLVLNIKLLNCAVFSSLFYSILLLNTLPFDEEFLRFISFSATTMRKKSKQL